MEQKTGYVLLNGSNAVIERWNQYNAPSIVILPNGLHLHAPEVGSYGEYKLVEEWQVSDHSIDTVKTGQTEEFDGTRWVVTFTYRALDQDELMNFSANTRYTKETSGITVSNNFIYTDRQSQAMISGIMTLISLQPNTVINFKTGNGFIQANSAVMNEIATSVASHVQDCFTLESQVAANIVSGSITSASQITSAYNV